jgi:hypothetical protein
MIAKAARELPPQMPVPPSYQKVNPGDQAVMLLVLRSQILPISTVVPVPQSPQVFSSQRGPGPVLRQHRGGSGYRVR